MPPRSSSLPRKRRRPGRPPSWGRDCSPGSRATTRCRWACSRKGWRVRAPSARQASGQCALAAIRLPRVREGRADPPRRGGDRTGPRLGRYLAAWTVVGNQGSLMCLLGETERAITLTEEAYRLCRGIGDVSLSGLWLSNLAAGRTSGRGLRHRSGEAERGARACPAHRRPARNRLLCCRSSAGSNCSRAISAAPCPASRSRRRSHGGSEVACAALM